MSYFLCNFASGFHSWLRDRNMQIKRFKDIVVTSDLNDLLLENGSAFGRSYMWQCVAGEITFEYAGTTYTMYANDLLFSPANRLPRVLSQSSGYRCVIFALDGKKVEDILYACLRDEDDWIEKLHFILRHPIIHLSPRQLKLITAYRGLVPLYSEETGRYRRRVAFLQGQSIIVGGRGNASFRGFSYHRLVPDESTVRGLSETAG